MKKILILSLIALCLLGAYYYLGNDSKPDTVVDDRAFAYKSFGDVDKIFIRERGVPGYFINKHKDSWWYKDSIKVSKYVMLNMQRAITQVTIKYIPIGNEAKSYMQAMNQNGIEVILYDKNNKVLRDYWVGNNTNSESGTAYLVRGATQPYVMEMPFEEGTMRGFFQNDINDIRDKHFLSLNPEDIKAVTVNYPKDTKNGFKIERVYNQEFKVDRLYKSGNEEQSTVNDKAIENYLLSFRSLNCETHEHNNKNRDKITERIPFCVYDMTLMNGETLSFKFWPLKDYLDLETNTKALDDLKLIERFFVETGDGKFYIVQYRNFKGLMVGYDFFF